MENALNKAHHLLYWTEVISANASQNDFPHRAGELQAALACNWEASALGSPAETVLGYQFPPKFCDFNGKNEKWSTDSRRNQGLLRGHRPMQGKQEPESVEFCSNFFLSYVPVASHPACSFRLQPGLPSSFSREGIMGTRQEIFPLMSEGGVLAHAIDFMTPFRCIAK